MNRLSSKFWLYSLIWVAINVLQSIFTELTNDEAYYFLYAQHPALGYYDHPPMVAWLVYLSNLLFDGNLSVRFTTIILQFLTLLFVWKLMPAKANDDVRTRRFFIIAASMPMLNAYGFITTPDVPLLFFTSLFLLSYQQFLKKETPFWLFWLTISMTGLVYSKYQAALVIGLVVLSNLRLLLNYRFWIAGILALALLFPHFSWQWQHDFPSFKYHLINRSSAFEWKYLFEYLPNQIAVFNPLTLGATFWLIYRFRIKDAFERSMYFLIFGFILFFAFTAFRGHVEPHWTMAAALPMIVLLTEKSMLHKTLGRFVDKYIGWSLVLIVVVRILLVTPYTPSRLAFYGKEHKYKAIEAVAGNAPVVFQGSFQNPSLYCYFTSKQSTVTSSLLSRRTQFDIWRFDKDFIGQTVFMYGDYPGYSNEYRVGDVKVPGFFTDKLQTTHDIHIKMSDLKYVSDNQFVMLVNLMNRGEVDFYFNHEVFPADIQMIVFNEKGRSEVKAQIVGSMRVLQPNKVYTVQLQFKFKELPLPEDKICLSLNSVLGPTVNSEIVPFSDLKKVLP